MLSHRVSHDDKSASKSSSKKTVIKIDNFSIDKKFDDKSFDERNFDGESETDKLGYVYPPQRKIFISNINSYIGFHLCQWILFSKDEFVLFECPNIKSFDDEDSDEEISETLESTENIVTENEEIVDGKKHNLYKIYGTLEENEYKYTNSISLDVEILNPGDANFSANVLECGIIICDINRDSIQVNQTDSILQSLEKYGTDLVALYGEEPIPKDKHRRFILISSIMTWAATKLESPLTEENYRKRLPHPCYTKYMTLEKNVVNLQKRYRQCLRTLVVCPGVIYGGAEDLFHYLFKLGYMNSLEIDVFAPADNAIPVIYLKDFVRIMKNLVLKFPKRSLRYILAVQPQPVIYNELASSISRWICGNEAVIRLKQKFEMVFTEETALTYRTFAHLTLNLRMEPSYLADYEFIITGDLDNFGDILAVEYRKERGLVPIKILIAGPPCCGKSLLAKSLAEYYGLHIVPERILEETIRLYKIKRRKVTEYIDVLEGNIEANIEGEEGEEEGEVESEQTELEDLKYPPYKEPTGLMLKLKDDLNEQLRVWDEKLADLLAMDTQVKNGEETAFNITKIVLQKRLYENACSSNQGYILDGFPYEYIQAQQVFSDDSIHNGEEVEEEEDNEYGDVTEKYTINAILKPEFVILLHADRDLCCARAMSIPETEAILAHNTELEVLQKLQIYQDQCHEDRSLLNYFLDRDIIPIEITITEKTTQKELFDQLRTVIGEPRNYLLSQAELDEIDRLEKEKARLEEEERNRAEAEKWANIEKERESKIQQWTDKFLRLKQEEQKLIELRSLPLRHYLMKYILPTLIKGLCEVIRCKPKDPIDFLAEFLFKFNTTGYMPPTQGNEEIKNLLIKNELELTQEEQDNDEINFEDEFKFCLEEINSFLK